MTHEPNKSSASVNLSEALQEISFLRGQLAAYEMQWEAMLRTLTNSGDLDRILGLLRENKEVFLKTKHIRH